MTACPSCAHENREGAKFCEECATPLGVPARPVAEERKVVTALFCDLVGFTATSESADPEDVGKMLAAYFEMARAQIESHGGVVEKFIGDAVVGVFGVPAAHEDDPERAVRAGLRICEDAEELTSVGGALLKLRVGINTGEALVRLGVRASSGEGFLAGDAINTASRIQSVAPEMGVAVGLGTYEATTVVFDYTELEPATLKGKAEPVRIFHAKSSFSRFGSDLTRVHDTPFIGREIDLALLKGIFDKTVAADSPQLVTVVGEPGLGKSRIVAELFGYVDDKPDLITWRQGRCLPYGEGITFWALGEILKAHAGILESDTPQVAETKLEAVLPEGDERPWFRQRLLPLLGIEANSTAEREELFTAWRRFLEHIAEQHPTVLVFEDLHWADDAMLSFLEHLADRAEGVPLLVVGTARPELYEHRPDFAGRRNANTINLAPLSEEETARLVSALLETTVIPAELQQPILDRAGGNPLYAEEFVRLLKDKDLLVQKGASWELREGAEVPFPDSVQALIAARLDTLSSDTKSMLADAAVIGKVFWAGAIAQMGERDLNQVTETLRELSRKELVRPARRSSIEGEAEYAFWHVLARDVAYGQLPRASRASRHVAAARWIESKAPERVEDLADVLAYHYATALELSQAAGQTEQAADLAAPARKFLVLAGERALDLDAAAALDNFERALELAPHDHQERARILGLLATALEVAGRTNDARAVCQEAVVASRQRGDLLGLASALCQLSDYDGHMATEALAVLEPLPRGAEHVKALGSMAAAFIRSAHPEEMLVWAEQAVLLSVELGLAHSRASSLAANAKCGLGRREGVDELRTLLQAQIEAGAGREASANYVNLGAKLLDFEGPVAAEEVWREGAKFAEARGLLWRASNCQQNVMLALWFEGRFDEQLSLRAILLDDVASRNAALEDETLADADMIAIIRGGADGRRVRSTIAQLDLAMGALAEGSMDDDTRVSLLATRAFLSAWLGDGESTRKSMEQLLAIPNVDRTQFYAWNLTWLVRSAVGLGDLNLAERLVAAVGARVPYAEHALVAANAALTEARGDLQAAADAHADAADRWERFGVVPEQAFALLGQGRCLLGLARPTEAAAVLQHAREIFERLQAAPALAETDALLAQATALSS